MGGRSTKWKSGGRTWLQPAVNLSNNLKNFSIKNICSSKNAIADSGCTNHYFCSSSLYINKIGMTCGISVIQPNGSIMWSSHTALMDAPHLPLAVRKVHIPPTMKNKALVSPGHFLTTDTKLPLKNPSSASSTSTTLPFPSTVPVILPTACGLWTSQPMLSSHLIHPPPPRCHR